MLYHVTFKKWKCKTNCACLLQQLMKWSILMFGRNQCEVSRRMLETLFTQISSSQLRINIKIRVNSDWFWAAVEFKIVCYQFSLSCPQNIIANESINKTNRFGNQRSLDLTMKNFNGSKWTVISKLRYFGVFTIKGCVFAVVWKSIA